MSCRNGYRPGSTRCNPGPGLAAVLATIERTRLGGSDTVSLLAARGRQVAYEQAQLLADLEEVSRTDWHTGPDTIARMPAADEFSVDQIGWALHWSTEAAKAHLAMAVDLLHRLPAVYAALEGGRIDLPRARVFHEMLLDCDDPVATAIVARLIDQAGQWTCGMLRERLRYRIHKHDPAAAQRRYQRVVTGRQVRAGANPDGTGYLAGTDLPVHRAAAADDYLSRLARAAKAAGDPRTLSQLRADAYLDLLTGIAFRTHPSRDPITTHADDQHNEQARQTEPAEPVGPVGPVGDDDAVVRQRWVPDWAVADPDQPPLGVAHLDPDQASVIRDEPGAIAQPGDA